MLLTRRVTFFGGKGGVGKSTLASAAALQAADAGRRTLLVSTDPAHSTSDVIGVGLGAEARVVTGTLEAIELDPEREAQRYIGEVKGRIADAVPPRLVAEVERQIDIAGVSPGAEEAALFERFARVLDVSADYEHVVFDTAPTGHTLRLLGLPEQMTAWMSGMIRRRRKVGAMGRMWRNVAGAVATAVPDEDPVLDALMERRDLFVRTRGILSDPARTAFLFVLNPRRLSILETGRAVAVLRKYEIPIGGIVINRADDRADGGCAPPPGAPDPLEAEFAAAGFADLPRWVLPTLEGEIIGLEALRGVARELTAFEPSRNRAAGR